MREPPNRAKSLQYHDNTTLGTTQGRVVPDPPYAAESSGGSEPATTFYEESYDRLRDALEGYLSDYLRDGEDSEDALYVDGIERAANRLAVLEEFVRSLADTDGWSAGEAQRRAHDLIYPDEMPRTAFPVDAPEVPNG